jgi:hypothetical protein
MTDPSTNLTDKFTALAAQLTEQHTEVLAAVAALRGAGPENTLKSLNQSIWNLAGPAPGATLAELLAALQAGGAGASDPNVAALLAAIGTLASNPSGYTVKDLLGRIDVDIAGTPVVPPDVLNNDPETCGLDFEYQSRTQGFTLIGTFSQDGVTYDSYSPNVPTYPILAAAGYPYVAGGDGDVYLSGPDDAVSVCVSWDWTGMEIPPASIQVIGTATIAEVWPSGLTVINERSYTGAYPRQLFQGDNMAIRFVVPAGQTLLNNVWWHAKLIPFTVA